MKSMLGNPKSLPVVVLSSLYALFTSFSPALSADIYCPEGGGTASVTINGTVFPAPPTDPTKISEWPIQSVTLDVGTSINNFEIIVIQRFTGTGVPDRHTTFLIGTNNVAQLSNLISNKSISHPSNCPLR
jgi:hypothetical protein